MSLHPNFPASPYEPLIPAHRWFPADEALRSRRDHLLEAIQLRFRKRVPVELKKQIERTADMATLEAWFRAVFSAQSLADYRSAIGQ